MCPTADRRGHVSVPELTHVLGGLHHWHPDYVQDVLADRNTPSWVTDAVAGIVVIRDPPPALQQLAVPVGHGQTPTQRHLTLVRSDDHRPSPAPAAESTVR